VVPVENRTRLRGLKASQRKSNENLSVIANFLAMLMFSSSIGRLRAVPELLIQLFRTYADVPGWPPRFGVTPRA
jgi:hypothetical protein